MVLRVGMRGRGRGEGGLGERAGEGGEVHEGVSCRFCVFRGFDQTRYSIIYSTHIHTNTT